MPAELWSTSTQAQAAVRLTRPDLGRWPSQVQQVRPFSKSPNELSYVDRDTLFRCHPCLLTLLSLSSGRWSCRCLGGEGSAGVEGAVELAGDVGLEAPLDLTAGLPLGSASGDILLRRRAAPRAGDGDGVDRAVEGPVTAAVEPLPNRPAALLGGGPAGSVSVTRCVTDPEPEGRGPRRI